MTKTTARIVRALAVVAMLGLSASRALASPFYTLIDLGVLPVAGTQPGDWSSSASAINDSGQVVGTVAYTASSLTVQGSGDGPGGDYQGSNQIPFIYSGGKMTALAPSGVAISINNQGQAIGEGDPERLTPFLYSHNTVAPIGPLAPSYPSFGLATGINDAGQIAGYIVGSDGIAHFIVLSGGRLQYIGDSVALAGLNSAINNAGQVAGTLVPHTSDGSGHAFLYSNGVMHDLGTLGGASSSAYALNASGQVVGFSDTQPGGASSQHAFLYSNGVMHDLGTLGGPTSIAEGINALDQVVGRSDVPGGSGPNGTHAFVYQNGTMIDLNTAISNQLGWTLLDASGINSLGQIAGSGVDPNGNSHAFLLTPDGATPPTSPVLPDPTPIPEPSTLALFGLLAMLGAPCVLSRTPRDQSV
jgi:probable HAF family extracellular repeat protein